MEIKSWSAAVKFVGIEGTSPAKQTIELTGTSCKGIDFPAVVAKSLEQSMVIFGDHSSYVKQIKDLEEKNDALKRTLALSQEAEDAHKSREAATPPIAAVADLPAVAEIDKPKRGRPRKSE